MPSVVDTVQVPVIGGGGVVDAVSLPPQPESTDAPPKAAAPTAVSFWRKALRVLSNIAEIFSGYDACILLKKNQNTKHVGWEIGYQLLNLLLQSRSLEISYRASLLEIETKRKLANSGINNASAILSLKVDDTEYKQIFQQ